MFAVSLLYVKVFSSPFFFDLSFHVLELQQTPHFCSFFLCFCLIILILFQCDKVELDCLGGLSISLAVPLFTYKTTHKLTGLTVINMKSSNWLLAYIKDSDKEVIM